MLLIYLFNQGTRTVFLALVLALGFLVLFRVLPFGRTQGEMLAYWVGATVALAVLLPRLSGRIDKLWRETNGEDD